MDWVESVLAILDDAVAQAGSPDKLAKLVGVPRSNIQKWQARTSYPTLDKIAPVMNYMGVLTARVGSEGAGLVSFANMKFDGMDGPRAEDYYAVPVLRDPNLIIGSNFFTPANNTYIFTLSSAIYHQVKGRQHMVGVFVHDRSMEPLLEPDDVVYVDRADTRVSEPGHLYLVRDKKTGEVCVRRVEEERGTTDTHWFFKADSKRTPTRYFSLNDHFDGKREEAILGRVIWARVDMRNL
ncbi:S24 family peptidase [Mailhella sp.]